MALAPSRLLFGVPSRVTSVSSILVWASPSMPPSASKISPLTASTALRTPLPPYRALSPSRSSTASCAPVDAPDGTAARPRAPSSRVTSTSTVGLPRLSRISRPTISVMAVMGGVAVTSAGLLQDRRPSFHVPLTPFHLPGKTGHPVFIQHATSSPRAFHPRSEWLGNNYNWGAPAPSLPHLTRRYSIASATPTPARTILRASPRPNSPRFAQSQASPILRI